MIKKRTSEILILPYHTVDTIRGRVTTRFLTCVLKGKYSVTHIEMESLFICVKSDRYIVKSYPYTHSFMKTVRR